MDDISAQPSIFMQDNAAIHNSKYTRDWLNSKNIDVLNWPARSPDLNIIENLWGHLARKVYANGRQYNNLIDLKSAIEYEFYNIDICYIQKLFDSIPNRIFDLILAKGSHINY